MMRRCIAAALAVMLALPLAGCDSMRGFSDEELIEEMERITAAHAKVEPDKEAEAAPDPTFEATPDPTPAPPPEPTGPTYAQAIAGRQIAPVVEIMETSSRDSRFYGKYAVDGDTATLWAPRADDAESCIALAFAGTVAVDTLVLLPGDQRGAEGFRDSGVPPVIELMFEDGGSEVFDVAPLAYGEALIARFDAREVRAVVLNAYAEQGAAISEIAFLMVAGREGVLAPEETLTPGETPAPGDMPEALEQQPDEEAQGAGRDGTGFVPQWFAWDVAKGDGQSIDSPYLRAGYYEDVQGTTLLYLDYSGAPDYARYELLWKGGQEYHDGALKISGDGRQGLCAVYGIRAASAEKGAALDITGPDGKETVRVYLTRGKYGAYD